MRTWPSAVATGAPGGAGVCRLARCCDLKLLAEKHALQIEQYRLPGLARLPVLLAPEWKTSPTEGQRNQTTARRSCTRKKKSRPSSSIENGSSSVFGPSAVNATDGHGTNLHCESQSMGMRHSSESTVLGCEPLLAAIRYTRPAPTSGATTQVPSAVR